MTALVFGSVLLSALLHAGWNVLIKIGLDRFSSVLLLSLAQMAIAIILLPFFEWPGADALPFIVMSAVLHTGYKLFMVSAYQRGDLSLVYPLARGSAPLLMVLAGPLLLPDEISLAKFIAIFLIGAGAILMTWGGRRAAAVRIPLSAIFFAIGMAVFIAVCNIVDGIGSRISTNPSAYLMSMVVLDGCFMIILGLARRGSGFIPALLPAWRSGLTAGAMALTSYWIAVWAFTQAPVAMVAALRETSVLFAMLIAAFALKERVTGWRWLAGGLILAGLVLMRL